MSKTLVAYFSASGITKKVAQNIQSALNADIYEIKPAIPYSDEDLNWMDKTSRSTIEMEDKSSRPEIITGELDTSKYSVIFLGFPIWWYIAPTIINTFLEAYDFSGKKIILFATSGGSGFGKTIDFLKDSAPNSEFIQGKLLNHNPSISDIQNWLKDLNL